MTNKTRTITVPIERPPSEKTRTITAVDMTNEKHAEQWRLKQARDLLRWAGYVEHPPGSDQWVKPDELEGE